MPPLTESRSWRAVATASLAIASLALAAYLAVPVYKRHIAAQPPPLPLGSVVTVRLDRRAMSGTVVAVSPPWLTLRDERGVEESIRLADIRSVDLHPAPDSPHARAYNARIERERVEREAEEQRFMEASREASRASSEEARRSIEKSLERFKRARGIDDASLAERAARRDRAEKEIRENPGGFLWAAMKLNERHDEDWLVNHPDFAEQQPKGPAER